MVKPPAWAHEALAAVKVLWPDGDPADLAIMSTDWRRFAMDVSALQFRLDQAMKTLAENNAGPAVFAMDTWWKETPKEGMKNLAEAATLVADRAQVTSKQVAGTQFGFVALLGTLAPVVGGSAAVGGALVAWFVKKTAGKLIGLIILAVGLAILYELHTQVKDKTTVKDDTTAGTTGQPPAPRFTPTPTPGPSPRPTLQPPDMPDLPDWPDAQPIGKCEIAPTPYVFARPEDMFSGDLSLVKGDGDWRMAVETNGGIRNIDIARIRYPSGSASHNITTDGFIMDGLAGKRQGLEDPMAWWVKQFQLPVDANGRLLYHRAHMWTWRFGSEVGTDVRLASEEFNLSWQKPVENFIVKEHQRVRGAGGWVELTTVMESQKVHDFTYQHRHPDGGYTDRPAGHQLLKNAYYNIRVCDYPGAEMKKYEYQLQQDLPYWDGNGVYQPGAVRAVKPTLKPPYLQ